MDSQQAATEFGRIFPEIYRHMRRRIHHTDYRLTSESLAVLRHLAATGPLTITECARHLDRSQAAMSEMVDRLVRRDVISRVADERDRRRTLVWLTDNGFAMLADANHVLAPELVEAAFRRLAPEVRARLVEDLRVLISEKGDRK